MTTEFIDKCISFAKIPSVSLFEKPLYDFILKTFQFDDYEKISDENYIAFIPKKNISNTVISVHIDRLGIVFNGSDFVYSNYYGYKLNSKKYKPALLFGKRFVGEKVVGYNLDGEIINDGIVRDCWIRDKDKELIFNIDGIEANKLTSPTPIAYKNELIIRNDEIEGQIDNVISLALVYFLLKENFGYTILFTTKEELGMSWQFICKFLENNSALTFNTGPGSLIRSISTICMNNISLQRSRRIRPCN